MADAQVFVGNYLSFITNQQIEFYKLFDGRRANPAQLKRSEANDRASALP
jgi:hypothetical protein